VALPKVGIVSRLKLVLDNTPPVRLRPLL
jgi:hypothetical protein